MTENREKIVGKIEENIRNIYILFHQLFPFLKEILCWLKKNIYCCFTSTFIVICTGKCQFCELEQNRTARTISDLTKCKCVASQNVCFYFDWQIYASVCSARNCRYTWSNCAMWLCCFPYNFHPQLILILEIATWGNWLRLFAVVIFSIVLRLWRNVVKYIKQNCSILKHATHHLLFSVLSAPLLFKGDKKRILWENSFKSHSTKTGKWKKTQRTVSWLNSHEDTVVWQFN